MRHRPASRAPGDAPIRPIPRPRFASDYRCEIVECVAERDRAFAGMRFSGRRTAPFRGYAPTGREVAWAGAALFRFADDVIAEVWVLGDLAGLDALLAEQTEVSGDRG